MKRVIIKLNFSFLITSALIISSCGGGSGSGDSSSSSTSSARTGVRVLHGAIDLAPVLSSSDINPSATYTNKFALSSIYNSFKIGTQSIKLATTANPNVFFSTHQITINKNDHYTVLVYGDQDRLGISSSIFHDSKPDLESTEGSIRFLDSVIGASDIDIDQDGSNIAKVSFGSASNYIKTNAGDHLFTIKRHVDNRTIYSSTINISAGQSYSLLVTGEIGYLVLAPLSLD